MIVIDSSDDEDDERISKTWTDYVDSYIKENDGNHDGAITARIRSKLKRNQRFLNRTIRKPTDMTQVVTTNSDYCRLDTKTLKTKPYYRADFYFLKKKSLQSTRQVDRTFKYFVSIDLF